MGYYKHSTAEKVYSKFVEENESTLDADFSLVPNVNYNRDEVYKIDGVGGMFKGTYRFRKISHQITTSGYTVNATGRMVYDAYGNYVEDGYQKGEGTGKEKAKTKTKPSEKYTVRKGDTLWSISRKLTGSPMNWKGIEKENRALLIARDKRNVQNSGHWIYPSQVLTIPGHLL